MSVPRFWRKIPYRYKLIGTKCEVCEEVYFPPRNICPRCRRSGSLREIRLSGRGKIATYTVIHSAPESFEHEAPYIIGIVELEEGPHLTTQIVDCNPEEIRIDTPVEMVFRKINEDGQTGIIYYGYKFRPLTT